MNRQNSQNDSAAPSGQAKQTKVVTHRSGAFHWLIAGGSLALLGGMVYWGLQLVERDPSQVPVIKAMEGPARTAPENPGGEIAEHLGLAVNKVQTGTGVSDEADSVSLAPEQHSLTNEEQTAAMVDPTPEAVIEPTSLTVDDEDIIVVEEPTIEAAALEEGKPEDPPAIVDATEADVIAAIEEAMKLADLGLETKPSIYPKLRPSDLKVASLAPAAVTKVETPKVETASTDPAFANRITEVAVGSKVVQLGAYDSEELALAEWKKLMGKHSDFLGPKKLLVQPVDSGGRKLFRLRAVGFEGRDEAKGFCTALNARGVACFALTAR